MWFLFVNFMETMATDKPKHLIVYAEDDADDRELMREAFDKYRHNIDLVMFTDGASVLRYLSRNTIVAPRPCLIILDINLPFFSGQQVLQQLRTIPDYDQTPVVFFTTSSQQRDVEFATGFNAGLITKPLTFRQIDGITEQLIDACEQKVRGQIRNPAL